MTPSPEYDMLVLRRAIKNRRPPLVIKQCERAGCDNEIRQHTYGPGRKYCSNACRYGKPKETINETR